MKTKLDMSTLEKIVFGEITLEDVAEDTDIKDSEASELLDWNNKNGCNAILSALLTTEPETTAYQRSFKTGIVNSAYVVLQRTEPIEDVPIAVIDEALGYPDRCPIESSVLFYAINLPRNKLKYLIDLISKSIEECVTVDKSRATRADTILLLVYETMNDIEKYEYWKNVLMTRMRIVLHVNKYSQ